MKHYLLFSLTAVICLILSPAIAVTQCVPSMYNMTKCNIGTGNNNNSWSASCSDGGSLSIFLYGSANCSSDSSSRGYGYKDMLTISSTLTNNKYCWCKLDRPYPTRWLYLYDASTGEICAKNCSEKCATTLQTLQGYRQAFAHTSALYR